MNYDFSGCDKMNVENHASFLTQTLGTIFDEFVPKIKLKRKEIPGFISIKHVKDRRKRKRL